MHRLSSPFLGLGSARGLQRRRQQGGFSLVEISLALGIIAFAFVALLGLLPVGLQTFRTAIDTGNEARIVQSFFSKLIATDFEKIRGLDFAASSEIYYFDEEGMPTDTSLHVVPQLESQRLYGAKLFIETPDVPNETLTYGVTAVVLFANMASPARTEFEGVNSVGELRTHMEKKKSSSDLRVRTLLVAKMDGK